MRRLLFLIALAAGLLALFAAPALASAKTFYVHPAARTTLTTSRPPSSHFYTNTVFVSGFHGYFEGAGEAGR